MNYFINLNVYRSLYHQGPKLLCWIIFLQKKLECIDAHNRHLQFQTLFSVWHCVWLSRHPFRFLPSKYYCISSEMKDSLDTVFKINNVELVISLPDRWIELEKNNKLSRWKFAKTSTTEQIHLPRPFWLPSICSRASVLAHMHTGALPFIYLLKHLMDGMHCTTQWKTHPYCQPCVSS